MCRIIRILLSCFVINVSICGVLYAGSVDAQTIQGAFGKNLAQVYGPAKKLDDSLRMWTFKPDKKSPYFESYYFWTSPLNKRIIGISALSESISLKACLKQADEVMNILKTKYHQSSLSAAVRTLPFSKYEKYERDLFVYHYKLHQGSKFIELSCLADIPALSNKQLDRSDKCYSSKKDVPFIEGITSALSLQNIYSLNYISATNFSGKYSSLSIRAYEAQIWDYIYANKTYRPVPSGGFRNYRIPECADVRLSIRYGDRSLESGTSQEFKAIRKRSILMNDKAQGL